jgi:hypothetical protein
MNSFTDELKELIDKWRDVLDAAVEDLVEEVNARAA